MDELTLAQRIVVWVIPVVFAITVHEVAHGWVAKLRGDNTASMLGRLTLNPVKHIDWIGTVLVPGILILSFTGFMPYMSGGKTPIGMNLWTIQLKTLNLWKNSVKHLWTSY